jgi:NAD(P)-dependent dehydrogenase (short-subunit alcohol dehydrogenase family)
MSRRTALVTGSTDGIGVAIARALATGGAEVIVSGRNAERGEQVVQSILAERGKARLAVADLSTPDGVHALAAAAGPVDILVNNAAMLITPKPTADVPDDVIDRALAINIRAAFLLTGLLAPAMVERGSGAIVNVGSINGLVGMAHSALYSATKAAIHSLTRSWAAEYGPAGVRVNTVAPGPTVTPVLAAHADRISASSTARRRSDRARPKRSLLWWRSW